MQLMKLKEGYDLPHGLLSILTVFSVLSLHDYVFIAQAAISSWFTIKTYYAKRREERNRLAEEQKRTRLLEAYLSEMATRPLHERPATAEMLTKAMKKPADQ
ncbi:hypothetical protein [Pseudescherichia sp.]|uniref:hypothetical protein n=1 Tax=Pseudescherichia TaxID=2055880 RepID=UPI003917E8D6